MTDYYARLDLSPAAPPAAIGAEITARLRTMPPGPERHLHEQARAVLADPAKRRIYDARPAEQWTPDDLHALAMEKSEPTARDRVQRVVGTGTQRVLVLVVAALAAILLIAVTAIACSSGGSSTSPSASNSVDGSTSPSATAEESSSAPSSKAPTSSKLKPMVSLNEEVELGDASIGRQTVKITRIAKASDPAPTCRGEYYAVTAVYTNGKAPLAIPSLSAAAVEADGTMRDERYTVPGGSYDSTENMCRIDAPDPLVDAGASVTRTVYSRSLVEDPVALKLGTRGMSFYVELPTDLRGPIHLPAPTR